MAAFSSSSSIFQQQQQQQQHPFLHPEFLPNSNCFFSRFIQLPNHHHHHHHQNPQIDNHLIDDQQLISTNKVVSATTASCIINNNNNNNEGCCSKKMNASSHVDNSSSIVTTDGVTTIHQGEFIITTTNNKRKSKHPSTSSAQSKDKKREVKGKKQKKMKKLGAEKEEEEEEEGPAAAAGYIHVRARRGQATDSHSLAERVRRERISERMKLLQSLVPGCDKVTGKALMLDEIINYVQSLQNQVEFLSMKLASLNPMFYDFGLDLESFMVTPHQHLSEVPSPLANMKECSPSAADDYHLLENSLVFQQPQIPNLFSQGSRETLWEVDEHRQKIMNESSSGLFSFH